MSGGILKELKRRHVFRVAGIYAVVGWLAVQVAAIAFPNLGAPDWVLPIFIVLTLIGFPVALVLAWALELTPDGIKPMPSPGRGEAATEAGNDLGTRDIGILVLLAVIATASL